MMKTELIKYNPYSTSCVGVMSEFPRGHGNYMSVVDREKNIEYEIVNLSREDLTDAVERGIIDTDTILADVYGSFETKDWDGNTIITKVAFIVDERFPEICLRPEWWYDHRNKFRIEILRKKYKVPDGVCLCEFEDSRNAGIFFGSYSYRIEGYVDREGHCYECGTHYRSVLRKQK